MTVPTGAIREDLATELALGKISYSQMVSLQSQPPPTVATAKPAAVPNAKVAMCFPSTYHVDAVWAFNMFLVMRQIPQNTELLTNWKYGLAETREWFVMKVMEDYKDVTHIMFIDADTIPQDVNVVQTLLAANVPFIGCMYWNSMNAGVNAWLRGDVIQQDQPAPIVQVDTIGIGCSLISMEVFRKMKELNIPRPWFYFHLGEKPGEMMSEDTHFQLLAKKAGFRPFIHTKCVCNHYKPMEFNVMGEAVYRQPSITT